MRDIIIKTMFYVERKIYPICNDVEVKSSLRKMKKVTYVISYYIYLLRYYYYYIIRSCSIPLVDEEHPKLNVSKYIKEEMIILVPMKLIEKLAQSHGAATMTYTPKYKSNPIGT
jgi:hypothetical protein